MVYSRSFIVLIFTDQKSTWKKKKKKVYLELDFVYIIWSRGKIFFFFPCGYLGDAAPFVKEAIAFLLCSANLDVLCSDFLKLYQICVK